MKRFLVLFLVLVGCTQQPEPTPTANPPDVSLETLALKQQEWVQTHFGESVEVSTPSKIVDGRYSFTVSSLPNASVKDAKSAEMKSRLTRSLNKERVLWEQLVRHNVKPLDHIQWIGGLGSRFTWKVKITCYVVGIFDCRENLTRISWWNAQGNTRVRSISSTPTANPYFVETVKYFHNNKAVYIDGVTDLVFVIDNIGGKGQKIVSGRSLRSRASRPRQEALNRMMVGKNLSPSTVSASTVLCSNMPDEGYIGGGTWCGSKRYTVDRNCSDCADFKRKYEAADDAMMRIENDEYPESMERKARAIGAGALCGASEASLIAAIPGFVPCLAALGLGLDLLIRDSGMHGRYHGWHASFNTNRKAFLNCIGNRTNCRGFASGEVCRLYRV